MRTQLGLCIALVLGLVPKGYALGIDWIETLPIHITAVQTCQDQLAIADPLVVDIQPGLNDAVVVFRAEGVQYACLVGVYGGTTQIAQEPNDDPLPPTFFTLLPGHPDQRQCYEHKLVHDYNKTPIEALGWVSNQVCTSGKEAP